MPIMGDQTLWVSWYEAVGGTQYNPCGVLVDLDFSKYSVLWRIGEFRGI